VTGQFSSLKRSPVARLFLANPTPFPTLAFLKEIGVNMSSEKWVTIQNRDHFLFKNPISFQSCGKFGPNKTRFSLFQTRNVCPLTIPLPDPGGDKVFSSKFLWECILRHLMPKAAS